MGLAWEEEHTTVRGETDSGFQQKQLLLPAQENLLAENSAEEFLLGKKEKKLITEKGANPIRIQSILHAFQEKGTKIPLQPLPTVTKACVLHLSPVRVQLRLARVL